jgi:alkanesulfonate monooxygenase SsuD/methylene tetrahydromethanopterin reductase-like flavin-dependent oxidoreductase (luciferase family)
MQLGAIHLWGEDEAKFRREIRLTAELGFDLVGVGDSPAGWHDLGISMAIAAAEAPGLTVASMVTSPFMRHPLVTANMMSTVHDLTGGKAVLGFATGGSTIMAIGHAPANQGEVRDEVAALRALFAGESTIWEGKPVKPLRFPRAVPIMYSAFGPKALRLAGECCDGAILFTGTNQMGELRQKIDAVRAAARAAGHDPMARKIWVTSFASVRESRRAALEDLKAFIVVTGMAIMRNAALAAELVPTQFKEKMERLIERYDPSEHVVVGGRNVALMSELGLTEFLGEFDTVAGSPAEVKATLAEMAAMGVDALFIPLPGHADPEPTIRAMAEITGRA